MSTDWQELDAELALWRRDGRVLPLWWRDDDAVAPTPALDRLRALAARSGLPVHIAVIPAGARPGLAAQAAEDPMLIPLVHGWAHENHAPVDQKKAEFGAHRPTGVMLAEAEKGLRHLRGLFGPALRPVFVPPWNRISPDVVAGLPTLGYRFLSTAAPRAAAQAAPGLIRVNTHLDPIDWRGTRGLLPRRVLVARVADHLRARREARSDAAEPYGVLTHHLVHDEDVWDFTGDLLSRLLDGPGRPWTFPRKEDLT